MINKLRLIRNIGQFDSVACADQIALNRLTLAYAENGRGKTTLAAVLRSLATGDPIPINERRRLSALNPPHVVIDCDGGISPAIFQNSTWNRKLPNIAIFDDIFVDQNVYSGLSVGADQRQNLHNLIIGEQGVSLNLQLQQFIGAIEVHNNALRRKSSAIPIEALGPFSVDNFCALPDRANIDVEIQTAERNLAAAREKDPIRETAAFDFLTLPAFDIDSIKNLLQQNLSALDAAAANRVQTHIASIGDRAESWIAEGMERIKDPVNADIVEKCPFCAQNLSESPVIRFYRVYFSDEYATLKQNVDHAIADVVRTHGGEVIAGFERAIRILNDRRHFWLQFCVVPDTSIDTAAIARSWRDARVDVLQELQTKKTTPLESIEISTATRNAIEMFDSYRQVIENLNEKMQHANSAIGVVKEQAVSANPSVLSADVARLKAIKARNIPTIASLCHAYLEEKEAKARTEQSRDQIKSALEQYRVRAFPEYEAAINQYLIRFNAGFRLHSVMSVNTRGGPTCTYNLIINNASVPIAGGPTNTGEPSFRNTLSAGDRNTLALAFFFASLDQDPQLQNKIVIIDDPISSLDEHRSLTTVQELRRLSQRVSQVILLSHSKPFLCRIWEGSDRTCRVALEIARDGMGSTIRPWNVDQNSITEHDKRHEKLRSYLINGSPNNREVAYSIRPLLEAFLRVAYPEHFPPGRLLGPFRNICEQRSCCPDEVLSAADMQELNDIIEFANRFHHETNPAWETEAINDGELRGFVDRVLRFTRR